MAGFDFFALKLAAIWELSGMMAGLKPRPDPRDCLHAVMLKGAGGYGRYMIVRPYDVHRDTLNAPPTSLGTVHTFTYDACVVCLKQIEPEEVTKIKDANRREQWR